MQRIVKTTDGGEHWTEMNLCEDASAREFGIGFLDSKTGYVGTMTGAFMTSDGGISWSKIELGKAINKFRFYQFENQKRAYAIGLGVYRMNW
jgi:photosystem II stability/assembly factor-like uncharacterized protein